MRQRMSRRFEIPWVFGFQGGSEGPGRRSGPAEGAGRGCGAHGTPYGRPRRAEPWESASRPVASMAPDYRRVIASTSNKSTINVSIDSFIESFLFRRLNGPHYGRQADRYSCGLWNHDDERGRPRQMPVQEVKDRSASTGDDRSRSGHCPGRRKPGRTPFRRASHRGYQSPFHLDLPSDVAARVDADAVVLPCSRHRPGSARP